MLDKIFCLSVLISFSSMAGASSPEFSIEDYGNTDPACKIEIQRALIPLFEQIRGEADEGRSIEVAVRVEERDEDLAGNAVRRVTKDPFIFPGPSAVNLVPYISVIVAEQNMPRVYTNQETLLITRKSHYFRMGGETPEIISGQSVEFYQPRNLRTRVKNYFRGGPTDSFEYKSLRRFTAVPGVCAEKIHALLKNAWQDHQEQRQIVLKYNQKLLEEKNSASGSKGQDNNGPHSSHQ